MCLYVSQYGAARFVQLNTTAASDTDPVLRGAKLPSSGASTDGCGQHRQSVDQHTHTHTQCSAVQELTLQAVSWRALLTPPRQERWPLSSQSGPGNRGRQLVRSPFPAQKPLQSAASSQRGAGLTQPATRRHRSNTTHTQRRIMFGEPGAKGVLLSTTRVHRLHAACQPQGSAAKPTCTDRGDKGCCATPQAPAEQQSAHTCSSCSQ